MNKPDSKAANLKQRGIYLLPNLLTTGGLFAGFYAIISGMNGRFESAAIAIFVAMVMDALDGRVARMTDSSSAFGAEYDSLSDMVAFGVAPACVIYTWSLMSLKSLGWAAAFLYVAAAALRLARFNTQVGIQDKRYFQGLPTPAAAGMLAGFTWLFHDIIDQPKILQLIAVTLVICAGLLMVSNIRYHSFKEFVVKDKVPFFTLLLVVLVFVFIALNPPQVLFGIFFLFAISGPTMTIYSLYQVRKNKYSTEKNDDDR